MANGGVPLGGVPGGVLHLWSLLPGAGVLWRSLPRARATATPAGRKRAAPAQLDHRDRQRVYRAKCRLRVTDAPSPRPLDPPPSHHPSGTWVFGPCATCVGACGWGDTENADPRVRRWGYRRRAPVRRGRRRRVSGVPPYEKRGPQRPGELIHHPGQERADDRHEVLVTTISVSLLLSAEDRRALVRDYAQRNQD